MEAILLSQKEHWKRWAYWLAVITIVYNLIEGLVSLAFGLEDETLALFGFGLDSFVEVVSGIGILHMVLRMQRSKTNDTDAFEQTALRITGTVFYILAAALAVTAIAFFIEQKTPQTTLAGAIVALISIITMSLLIRAKMKAGTELGSDAMIADARCTRTCLQLSYVLLVSSVLFELTGIAGLDAAGALIIGGLSFREGREAFEKARGKNCGCSDDACHTD